MSHVIGHVSCNFICHMPFVMSYVMSCHVMSCRQQDKQLSMGSLDGQAERDEAGAGAPGHLLQWAHILSPLKQGLKCALNGKNKTTLFYQLLNC